MESSFAFCENTILSAAVDANAPAASGVRWSAGDDDFEGRRSRFIRLVGFEPVGGAGDVELVPTHAHVGAAATAPGVHPGEPTQIADGHRLGCCRLRPLVDDNLGSGKVAADIDGPSPLQLTALHDVEIRVVAVDGHRCRAGELGWGSRGGGR